MPRPNNKKELTYKRDEIIDIYRRSLCETGPFSSFCDTKPKTLHASFAKSKSRTSTGDTGIKANASLSSLTGAAPTCISKMNQKSLE